MSTQEQEKPDWMKRVEAEYAALQESTDKLADFLDKVEEGTEKVDPVTRSLLVAQHGLMTAYLAILYVRMTTRVVANQP